MSTKTKEWTYRPKYTKARTAKELADKEQELTSILVELLRVQTTEGTEMKDIVFHCFVQMLQDFKLARETLADCMHPEHDPDDFFSDVQLNINPYFWFIELIRKCIWSIDESARQRENEELERLLKEDKEDA